MAKVIGMLAILVLALIVAGGVYLATVTIPPPSAKVVKVIPDARFPR
jgi:hypothetical protein